MNTILRSIIELNKVARHLNVAEGKVAIIKKFTNESVKILNADFGFAWGKFNDERTYELVYQNKNAPKNPVLPKEKDKNNLMIPIHYGDHVYGSIILGYEKPHDFNEEELALADTIGHIVAQAITINWLVENEQRALALAEKQKETEVLLSQEKLKTEFIENATHELRTPLAIMKGNIDLASINGNDPKEMESALKSVNREIGHLSHIIEDLALITSGKRDEDASGNSRLNILHLLETTIERLNPLSNQRKISIKITVEEAENLHILGNEKHLEKLFANIIKNAISYGKDSGQIDIEVSQQQKLINIKIIDNGIGISKEDMPKLFERFYRTEDARMMRKKGTGLGLAISKWITETHGGRIEIESTLGTGTTVTIELPLAKEN